MTLVCIDCRYVDGRPSGIGEMVTELVRRVPQLAPDLRFRLLVSPNAPHRLSDAANVDQVAVAAAANGPATMWWLPHIVDLSDVDLFHATFNILPAKLLMPCVTTVHDVMWLERPDLCETGWRRLVRQAFFAHGIRRALARSTVIATVSEATRNRIRHVAPQAASRSFVTRSGVGAAFRPVAQNPSVLREMGLDTCHRFILCVGQNAPYKNHAGAIRAFALVCERHDDIHLVLVQRQNRHAAPLLALARQLGVADRVHFRPALSQQQLIQLYSSAALLLHPSFCEGFGHPLAEAMACGCPVVTGNQSAMAEVTAGAALLVDPDDARETALAIGRILNNRDVADDLRQRGLERASQLSWDDFADATLALYRRALGPPLP